MGTRSRLARLVGRGSVTLTVLAGASAIVGGTTLALLGFVFPDLSDLAVRLPVVVPVGLVGLSLLLAATAAAMLLADSRTRDVKVLCLLLVAGPLLVLLGAEILPHLATPCLAGEIPGVCEATEQGEVDYADNVHALGHALVGWVPLTLLNVWSLRRWWPDIVPGWVPGARQRQLASAPYSRAT